MKAHNELTEDDIVTTPNKEDNTILYVVRCYVDKEETQVCLRTDNIDNPKVSKKEFLTMIYKH